MEKVWTLNDRGEKRSVKLLILVDFLLFYFLRTYIYKLRRFPAKGRSSTCTRLLFVFMEKSIWLAIHHTCATRLPPLSQRQQRRICRGECTKNDRDRKRGCRKGGKWYRKSNDTKNIEAHYRKTWEKTIKINLNPSIGHAPISIVDFDNKLLITLEQAQRRLKRKSFIGCKSKYSMLALCIKVVFSVQQFKLLVDACNKLLVKNRPSCTEPSNLEYCKFLWITVNKSKVVTLTTVKVLSHFSKYFGLDIQEILPLVFFLDRIPRTRPTLY